jgi:hypothetical protein
LHTDNANAATNLLMDNAASQNSNMSLDTEGTSTSAPTEINESAVASINMETKDSIRFQLAPLISRNAADAEWKLPAFGSAKKQPFQVAPAVDAGVVTAEQPKKDSNAQPTAPAVPVNKEQPKQDTRASEESKREVQIAASSNNPKKNDAARRPDFPPTMECQADALQTIGRETSEHPRSSGSESSSNSSISPSRMSLHATSAQGIPLLLSNRKSCHGTIRSQRPPLQFKAFGLQGKAERVDPSQSVLETESDSEPEGGTPARNNDNNKTPSKPVSKIAKMDLDYMWNWDPDKRNTPATQTNSSLKASHSKSQGLGKIEETPSVSLSSASNASGTSQSRSSNSGKSSNVSGDSGATEMATQAVCDST